MKEILQALITRLQLVPGMMDVRPYNSQLENLGQEVAFYFPAALVEIRNIRYTQRPGSRRDAFAEIRVHVLNNKLMQGQGDYSIYELSDLVQRYLSGWSDGRFQPLSLTASELDHDHDNVFDYVLDYKTGWLEETPPPVPDTPVQVASLLLATELDVDNPTLRTGDGVVAGFEPAEAVSADPLDQLSPQQIVDQYDRLPELVTLLSAPVTLTNPNTEPAQVLTLTPGSSYTVPLVAQLRRLRFRFAPDSADLFTMVVTAEDAGAFEQLSGAGTIRRNGIVLLPTPSAPVLLAAGDQLVVQRTMPGVVTELTLS